MFASQLVPLLAIVAASGGAASEGRVKVDVPALPVRQAAIILGVQARIGIGVRDVSIAGIRTHPVKGGMTPERALFVMLAGTGMKSRRVAPAAYVIERSASIQPSAIKSRAKAVIPSPTPSPEIVVTATKRGVPFYAYAGTAEIIDGNRISLADVNQGSEVLESRAVGLTSTHLGAGRNKLFIRGIADSSFVGPTESTVGQYWGEQRVSYGAPDPGLRLLDIERVEVLEGPQGTLYGTGSLGGLVRVIPTAPDLGLLTASLWGGARGVSQGAVGGDVGAVFNLPLVPGRVALRLVGYGAKDGGYIDDVTRHLRDVNDVNDVTTAGGRAALRVEASNGWMLDAQALGQRIVGRDGQYVDHRGGLTRAGRVAEPYANHYSLVGLSLTKSFDGVALTLTAGRSRQMVRELFEAPAAIGGLREVSDAVRLIGQSRSVLATGEVRLSRQGLNGAGWVFGANVLQNSSKIRHGVEGSTTDIADLSSAVIETTMYGEYAVAVAKSVTMAAGARLSRAKLATGLNRLGGSGASEGPEKADRTERRLLPAVSASYSPAEKWILFVRYQQGFRPGGQALRQNLVQPFSGDRIASLEAGTRISFDKFDAGATVAHTRWHDIQADIVDELGFATTTNVGDGRVASLEGYLRWRPTSQLRLEAAANWNNGRLVARTFSTLPFRPGDVDDRLPNVVKANARFAASYGYELARNVHAMIDGSVRYVGRSTLGIGSILGRDQGDYTDTAIELRLDGSTRHVSISMSNLLGVRGNRFSLGSPYLVRDEPQFTPLQPRSLRVGFAIDM